MELTFAPRDILQVDNARIIWPNFAGAAGTYNREGDREFNLVIPTEEMADELVARGWNVKIKPPRDDDDNPFMFLKVKVSFNEYGPNIYLHSGNNVRPLNEETVGCLDRMNISHCDMDIRPYDWEFNKKSGRTAYLQTLHVFQQVDRFAEKYGDWVEEDTLPI